MPPTSLDTRQSQMRTLLDQINSAAVTQLDSTLSAINSELTAPGRLIAQATPSLVVSVGSGTVVNPNTLKNRSIPPISNLVPSFAGGTITFPSTSGTITVSPGTNASITIGANQFVPVLVQLTSTGSLLLFVGSAVGSLGAVVVPAGDASSLSLGYIVAESNGSSVIQNITNAMLYQFVGGGGTGGTSTSSGIGDDLGTLAWKASFTDNFPSIPSASGAVNISAGFTNPANYSVANKLWALNYDATKTVTGTGTSMSISSAPSFTIAAGDMLIVNGSARRITVVTTQISVTIESAFPTDPSASPCTVSQAVYTVDLNNYTDAGISVASVLPDTISSMMIEYDDSTSTVLQEGVPPNVGFTASSDGTNFSPVGLRTVNLTDVDNTFALPNSGSDLFIRFFANKSSGSGVVNFFRYRAFFHAQTNLDNGGFVQAQAYTRLDGLGAQINCFAPTVVNGKTRISLTSSFGFYTPGINAGQPNGQLFITVNGQKIPRFIDATTTPNAYYKEINSSIIELDSDYSSFDFDIEILKLFASSSSGGGGGGGGSKNYLSSIITSNSSGNPNPGNGDFEQGSTAGWSLAHSALSSFIPTSVASPGAAFSSSSGGSAAAGALTFSTVTSGNQIAGSFSGDLASSSASTAGDLLISDAFFIDSEDKAKVLTFKFYYEAISGSFNFSGTNANSFAIWLYDVTNGAWIQPAGVYGMTQGSGVGYVTGTFQTTSNSTKYQLAIININATAGAYSLYVDDFVVGPQTAPFGPIVTDWADYSLTNTQGFGTVSSSKARYRIVGDSVEINVGFTTGTVTASLAEVNLPPGMVVDSAKITQGVIVGTAAAGNNGDAYYTVLAGPGSTFVTFGIQQSTRNSLTSYNGSDIVGSTTSWAFWALIPIAGKSSNVQMSNDTDTRVVAAHIGLATNYSVGSGAVIKFDTVDFDTHSGYSPSTGLYTVPVSGKYRVSATAIENTNPFSAFVAKNGSNAAFLFTVPTTNQIHSGSATVDCKAGDTLAVFSDSSTTIVGQTPFQSQVNFERLSGPAVVAATEKIVAAYYQDGAGSVSTGAAAIIVYANKDIDTHNAVSGGRFTVPVSGTYQCSFSGNGGSAVTIFIYKNGVQARLLTPNAAGSGGAGSLPITALAGDILDFRPDGSVTINSGTLAFSLIK